MKTRTRDLGFVFPSVVAPYSAYLAIFAFTLVIAHRTGFHLRLNYEVANLESAQTAIVSAAFDVFVVFVILAIFFTIAILASDAVKITSTVRIKSITDVVLLIALYMLAAFLVWNMGSPLPPYEQKAFFGAALIIFILVPLGFLFPPVGLAATFWVPIVFAMAIIMSYALGGGSLTKLLLCSTSVVAETNGELTVGHVLLLSEHHVVICRSDSGVVCKLIFKDAVRHVTIHPTQ